MLAKRTPELAIAAIAFLLAIPATYALTRVVEARLFPGTNPALVVWTTRTAMYWRTAIGVYVGALLAPIVYAWARRDLDAATRGLGVAAIVVAVVATLQGAFVP